MHVRHVQCMLSHIRNLNHVCAVLQARLILIVKLLLGLFCRSMAEFPIGMAWCFAAHGRPEGQQMGEPWLSTNAALLKVMKQQQ